MFSNRLLSTFAFFLLSICLSRAAPRNTGAHFPISQRKNGSTNPNLVTWDEKSFMIRGERLFLFGGEFHPFRLPVPGLWLDIFQKIKSMGFNGVSFYTCWGLLEATEGHVVTDGIWSLQPFFDAAAEAGIYLIARPGPYINAETAAGGMPGWTLRIPSRLRSDAPDYTQSIVRYMQTLGRDIAAAQITRGGPVILVQPENEYTTWPNETATQFPEPFNREYMAFVEQQLFDAGIEVPLIINDNEVKGYWAPDTGLGSANIYGIDAYPMRYDCATPDYWPHKEFPRDWYLIHEQESPTTPFAIPEFQGGAGSAWGPGSVNGDACNGLVNEESVRVLYKNNYSFGVKLMSIYMTYGGTNWGNLGYDGGNSEYDYGAAITQDRHVWREKYSEEKLEANFMKVSPAYLTATPGNASNGSYASTDQLAVTPIFGSGYLTNFYIVRQANWTSTAHTDYTITLPIQGTDITLPRLGGHLSLDGRDSKIHVTNYDVGGIDMIYCTADITTWARGTTGKRVLVMYGGADEVHEFAFDAEYGKPILAEGEGVIIEQQNSSWVVQWQVSPERQIVQVPNGDLEIRMLWRNDAYNTWVLELSAPAPISNYSSPSKSYVIVSGGYLMRTAIIDGSQLKLTGDLNATVDLELVFEPTGAVDEILFNGNLLETRRNTLGHLTSTLSFQTPELSLPNLTTVEWKCVDTLPELGSTYDDSLWEDCDHTTTTNDQMALLTPTSLYATDYGYNVGSLEYRGHFFANGREDYLYLNVSGGTGFGHSVWLNGTFLGSWTGSGDNATYPWSANITSPLQPGASYVFMVLIDHMSQTEESPGTDTIKFPFGLLNYHLAGHDQTDISWKMTGNFGGEHYIDKVRGPRNEGAMFAERQGFHYPAPPDEKWTVSSPMVGLKQAGVKFYTTSFELHIPTGYDVPMSVQFNGGTYGGANYRVQFFVNGYQFGKYVNNLGPQTTYPVPEGILNYDGENWLALTLWALDASGARLDSLTLVPEMPVLTSYRRPALSPAPRWALRPRAY